MTVALQSHDDDAPLAHPAVHPLAETLVVGGGPVGIRLGQLLAQRGTTVTVLGREPHAPYNRVRLTPLLSGDVQFGEIALTGALGARAGLNIHTGAHVVEIDRENRIAKTASGDIWPYKTLVLATGSRAFVPQIPGKDLPGVYTFRTADDASALLARSFSARRVVIVGGGLLGLEAARGLRKRGCHVTVIEHENRLMPRQLDRDAATLLAGRISALGVDVRTGTRLAQITGDTRVEAVQLGDGTDLPCDTVVICTGVRANIELARSAGLGCERGILVNDRMQTRDPAIFAVGECAQFDNHVVGLVGPGYAQAEVAADVISGKDSAYAPPPSATKLKVIGADVFSVGDVEQLEVRANVKSHVWQAEDGYRRIFVERGRLVGVIAVGAWAQTSRLQEAAQSGATVYPWMLLRFLRTGDLWAQGEQAVAEMTDAATLCNCTGVNCGQIRAVLARVPDAPATQVSAETGAGTVCGTCRPLIEEMVDAGAPPKPVPFAKPLLALSGGAALVAVMPLLAGYVPLPAAYDAESLRVWAWRDNIVKQWSGYVLVGILCAALLIGLRKRIRLTDRLGSYDGWRLVHIAIGVIALLGFFAHTGFRLGANWNMALGLSFVATLILGAIAGLATGGEHRLRAAGVGTTRKPARRLPTWMHILAIWPLPVLLIFHVLTVYAF